MQRKRGEGGVGVSFVKLCFGWLGPGKIEAILFVRFSVLGTQFVASLFLLE